MSTQFENGYALLIGVNESQEKRLALPDVLKDVKALEKVLVHPERCSFPQDNVKLLTGTQATRMGILGGLTWLKQCLSKDTSGNATVLVYYTGHGWRDESVTPPDHYLIPFDVSESMMSMSAIRANEFSTAISALQPRRLLVILDCCHAGGMGVKDIETMSGFKSIGFSPELFMMGQVGVSASKGIGELMTLQTGTGRAVLSSSQGEQSSWMRRDGTMSIFIYHLIEALTGHAQPEGGANEVLVSDVMSYVCRHVPESTKREWDAEQQPDYQVSGNFPVALLLGGKGLSRGQKAPDPLEISRGEPESPRPHIDTGGGAYIAGEVHVEGGNFVGRDQTVHGDQIHVGDISGQGIAIGQGARAEVNTGDTFNMSGTIQRIKPTMVEEPIRLDVAAPKKAIKNEVFTLVVAVRQPGSPLLTTDELQQVVSEDGSVFYKPNDETIKYRIKVSAAYCDVDPEEIPLKLRPKTDSRPCRFQVTPHLEGDCLILVNAFQEDDCLAAQTQISLQVEVSVSNKDDSDWANQKCNFPQERYVEYHIYKGDVYQLSGDFRYAILNIKNILGNVVQTIGAIPNADNTTKIDLERLIKQLDEYLQQVPPEKAEEAQAIATQTQLLVQEAAKEKPNKPLLQMTGEGLKKASENIFAVMPTVLGIVTQIVTVVARMVK